MMHGHEKSDPEIVAMKPTNKPANALRSWWSEGQGPREMRASKARSGHRTGQACHRRWIAYGKPQGTRRRKFTALSTTSTPKCCVGVLLRSKRTRPPEWMG